MKINEENFIEQLKLKNEKAIEYVILNYGWIIKTITSRNLNNLKFYQEECINDVLMAIWNNIESFDYKKNTFKNWIAAITRYKTIDYKRKYIKKFVNESIENIEIASEDNIVLSLINKEILEEIKSMLECLNEQDREIFKMIFFKDIKIDEVSNKIGLNKNIIYNRISRGKQKIRRLFSVERKELK